MNIIDLSGIPRAYRRPGKALKYSNILLWQAPSALASSDLIRELHRSTKKIIMKKRSLRAKLLKSRLARAPKVRRSSMPYEDSDVEDEEEYIPYVPPIEVIEPLYVFTTTTLPACVADTKVSKMWYGCSRCIRVFQTAEERNNHKAVHKRSRNETALTEVSDFESFGEEAADTTANPERPELMLTANPSEIPLKEDEQEESDLLGNLKPIQLTRGKSNVRGTSQLQCNICTDTFSSRKDLKLHVIGHNLSKPEKAIHLGIGNNKGKRKSFDANSSFEEEGTPYDDSDLPELKKKQNLSCKICAKVFGHEDSLKRHVKSHAGAKEAQGRPTLKSSILGEGTNSKQGLSRQGRKHGSRIY